MRTTSRPAAFVPSCHCARHADGSVSTWTCPVHADIDPCLTYARTTGRRRRGTIRNGVCTSCGHGTPVPSTPAASAHAAEVAELTERRDNMQAAIGSGRLNAHALDVLTAAVTAIGQELAALEGTSTGTGAEVAA